MGAQDMDELHYAVVEHDGGWAYKLKDVFSETFATKADAEAAARRAAAEQTLAGETEVIQYQDDKGAWHDEVAQGTDRPATVVDE